MAEDFAAAAQVGTAAAQVDLLRLPDTVLCHILRLLPSSASISSAVRTCRAFHTAAGQDDGVWLRASTMEAWRLRVREGDHPREMCLRARSALVNQRIVLLGGCNGSADALSLCESYDVRSGEWRSEEPLTVERDAPAVACDGSSITLFGGWDGADSATSTVEQAWFGRDHTSANDGGVGSRRADGRIGGAWTGLTPLPQPLCFGAADVDANRRLFFVGGGSSIYRGAECSREVRLLDGATWRTVGAMLSPRCGLGLASDPRGTLLYAAGGYAGGIDYLSTAEWFDTHTGKAHALHSMSAARSGPGAAFGPDGAVYVVGGSADGNNALASCERIDPREGKWQPIAPLPTARGFLSAIFSIDGCLYAAGGAMERSDQWPCDAFEKFDPRAGAWAELPALPTARANLASALVV